MFILVCKTPRSTVARLYNDRNTAIIAADEFAGPHYPHDGCSSEPYITDLGGVYRVRRSSSWGERRAAVHPVSTAEFLPLV